MRKVILVFLLIFLSACQTKNEVVIPPAHDQLGKICTLVTTFDDDMVNVSIYYTQNEAYPIQNEEEMFKINDMILKHSSSGLKDIKKYPVNNGEIGEVTQMLYDTLTGIQWGKIEDTFGWTYPIK